MRILGAPEAFFGNRISIIMDTAYLKFSWWNRKVFIKSQGFCYEKKFFFFFISFFSSRLHHFVYLSYSMSHTLLDCVFSGFFVFCICLCSMSNLLSFFLFFNTRRCRSEFFGFLLISTQSIFFSVGFRLINALKLITGFYLRLLAHHQV